MQRGGAIRHRRVYIRVTVQEQAHGLRVPASYRIRECDAAFSAEAGCRQKDRDKSATDYLQGHARYSSAKW
jgi:hypothetical protein